ncbi:hypothetical protein GUJ93_ZPchr0010g9470 [Zizania palustris]|uniref:Uncharacterized protein n=1 Tax=Zizania palustris TaxID=103762 RepID=A0A8J5W783_ZIZPA|nr:hypothetical protein GUJ93_ZPchr0010g9470 [Zizania palustris]
MTMVKGKTLSKVHHKNLVALFAGSKDETFFDSRAWLDSECEDDFYSVNGDFTPSRGNTSNYQPRTQKVMSNVFVPDNVHDT